MSKLEDIMEEIKERIRYDDLNDDINIVPRWFKEKDDKVPHYDEYKKCFLDGVNCQRYTDLTIVSEVLGKYLEEQQNMNQ